MYACAWYISGFGESWWSWNCWLLVGGWMVGWMGMEIEILLGSFSWWRAGGGGSLGASISMLIYSAFTLLSTSSCNFPNKSSTCTSYIWRLLVFYKPNLLGIADIWLQYWINFLSPSCSPSCPFILKLCTNKTSIWLQDWSMDDAVLGYIFNFDFERFIRFFTWLVVKSMQFHCVINSPTKIEGLNISFHEN